ncbi:MAG: hypothetical protein ACFCBW_10180 [Candidatus Competibacterales bacterium]
MTHLARRLALSLGLVASSTLSSGAVADQINGASPTGSYTTVFAPLIKKVLDENFFYFDIAPSAGSVEAFERVLDNPGQISIGQLDVVAILAQENPDQVTIVRRLANECLYAVAQSDAIGNWRELERVARRARIVTAAEKSGSNFTLKTIMTLNPEGRMAQAVDRVVNLDDAATAFERVAAGEADVAFAVAYPDPESRLFEIARENDLNFVPVGTPAMRRVQVDGQSVYTPSQITIEEGGLFSEAKTVTTSCTSAVIFTGSLSRFEEGSEAYLDQQDKIGILREAPDEAFVPDDDRWTRIFSSARNLASDAADSFWGLVDSVGGDGEAKE